MKFSTTLRTNRATEIRDACNSLYLNLYNGTEPATPATALSGNTLLASMQLAATSGTISSGVLTFDTTGITDSSANATGTPTFARIGASDGTSCVVQLTAGVGSGEVNCAASMTSGEPVPLTSAVITEGNA